MRILQIVQRPQRRGAELFAFDLSGSLESKGHDVKTLYLYRAERGRALSLRTMDSGLEGAYHHLFERLPGFHPTVLRRVIHEIQGFQPDIVQANGARTVKYGAAAKFLLRSNGGWKLVYRNIGIPSDWHSWPGTVWVYRHLIMPRMDGVVGVSRCSLDDVHSLYGIRAPSMVILNGISPARLDVVEGRNELRSRYGASLEDLLLLHVGHLEQAKRPDRFVRVLSRVVREVPRTRAWIVGDGPRREEIERLSRSLGISDRIHFFGDQEDVASFMNAADVLMVTSDTEGIPATVLEAGFLGLPVVASNVGGLPECVDHGATGILVDDGNLEEGLSRAVVALASDDELRRSMGQRARERVLNELTIDRIADQYVTFYEEVLGHRSVCHESSI